MNGLRRRCVRAALPLALAALTLAASPARAALDEIVRLAAIVASGVPRGLVTVVVPIPAELVDRPDVSFEVRAVGGIEVLGRLSGPARVAGGPSRPLVLTFRVPANSAAGVVDAAEVIFRAGTGVEYRVPLQLRVTVVRSVTLLGSREMRGLRAGDRLELPFRIVNGGNATDTVRIGVQGPLGWITRLDRPVVAVVPARGQVEFSVSIGIPSVANIGDHTLAVSIHGAANPDAVTTVFTTLGLVGRAGATAGLVLRSSLAAATSSEGSATFTGVELAGPVAHEVTLRAQLSPGFTGSGVTMMGLSAVGASPSPFAASLSGPGWDLIAGNTSMQLSELGGVNLLGRGVTAQMDRGAREARAIIARPASGTRAVGQLIGAGLWQRTAAGRFGATASYLSDRGGFAGGRELTAFAAEYRSQPLGSLTMGAALAHRSSGDLSGIGYSGSLVHERPSDRAAFRLTHAPGGTAAFARATDEWEFEGSRLLTERWSLDASAQRSRDAGRVFGGMRSGSWTLGQRFAYTPTAAFTLRAQSSTFSADAGDGEIGGFGAGDRELVAGFEWRRELLAISAEGSYGEVLRSTELLDGRVSESAALQRGLRVSMTRGLAQWGMLDANAGIEQTASGVGLPSQVWRGGLRWSEIPLAVGTRQARLNVESSLQRLGYLPTAVVTRATLRTALPAGLDLVFSAERNPFLRDSRGRAGWIAAVRVTASTRVFSPKALGPEGIVYEDRDLDGKRGPDEPGVAGVVVRRGDGRATTDREGRYRLPLAARGRTRIDQGSLPIGLVAHPLLAADSLERLELPVLPTGSVVVELALAADADGRVPVADLRPAVVILREAGGFEWVGRRTSPTTATFESLPTGAYELVVNFALGSEPLRIEDRLQVEVVPHQSRTLAVRVMGRSVRIFTPPARNRDGGSSPPGTP